MSNTIPIPAFVVDSCHAGREKNQCIFLTTSSQSVRKTSLGQFTFISITFYSGWCRSQFVTFFPLIFSAFQEIVCALFYLQHICEEIAECQVKFDR